MRILVVEDNHRLNSSLAASLTHEGYSVDSAYDGQEGQDLAELTAYDLIILDVLLPEKDGLEVCCDLRRRRIQTPILLLTARDSIDDRVQGLDCGADDYLVKPFAMRELLARLRALLANQSPTALNLKLSSQELVLLLDSRGNVLDSRGPLTSSLIRQLQARAGQDSGPIDLAVPQNHAHSWWNQDTQYLGLSTPVLNQNTRVATLLVGLQSLQHSFAFLAIWISWGLLALLVAATGGYWLAGKALRPVNMITRMANEINATDLRRRLNLRRRDEFGKLAATFDQIEPGDSGDRRPARTAGARRPSLSGADADQPDRERDQVYQRYRETRARRTGLRTETPGGCARTG